MNLIYERIDDKGNFRIINYLGRDINQRDQRRLPKSMVCHKAPKNTLYEILVRVGYPQPVAIRSIEVPDNEQEIRKYL